jgi:hypothetical protein
MVIVILEWLSLLALGKYAWPGACSQCQQSTIFGHFWPIKSIICDCNHWSS